MQCLRISARRTASHRLFPAVVVYKIYRKGSGVFKASCIFPGLQLARQQRTSSDADGYGRKIEPEMGYDSLQIQPRKSGLNWFKIIQNQLNLTHEKNPEIRRFRGF